MFGLDKYNYTSDKTFRVYSFLSNGPNGPIRKIAKFTEMGENIFNFGFGDYDPVANDISDKKGVNYDAFLGRHKGASSVIGNQ
jgi:hypothetical protein